MRLLRTIQLTNIFHGNKFAHSYSSSFNSSIKPCTILLLIATIPIFSQLPYPHNFLCIINNLEPANIGLCQDD